MPHLESRESILTYWLAFSQFVVFGDALDILFHISLYIPNIKCPGITNVGCSRIPNIGCPRIPNIGSRIPDTAATRKGIPNIGGQGRGFAILVGQGNLRSRLWKAN